MKKQFFTTIFIALTTFISSSFAENALTPTIIQDIERQPNHVKQLQQVTAAYLKEEEAPQFSASAFPLLTGAKGLAKTSKQISHLTPELKAKQAKWALEFILRYSANQIRDFRQNPDDHKIKNFLTRTAESLLGTDASSLDIEHIAYLVVLSLAFQWEVDHQLYTTPLHAETQLAFLCAEHSYAALTTHSPALQQRVYAKAQEKLNSQAKLDAFLKKSGYAATAPAVINFLQTPTLATCPKIPGYVNSLSGTYETPIKTDFTYIFGPPPPGKKEFQSHVAGTIKGVKGDGTCYFHTLRDFRQNVTDWGSSAMPTTRKFVAAEIEQHLDDPVVRHWLSEEAIKHLTDYIKGGTNYPWLQKFAIGKRFFDIIKQQKQIDTETTAIINKRRPLAEELDPLLKTPPVNPTRKNTLQEQIDALNVEVANKRTAANALAIELQAASVALQQLFYTPEGAKIYLKAIIVDTNEWALDGSLLNFIFSYLYETEIYLFQTPEDALSTLSLGTKIRMAPTEHQHGIVHHTNHFMWIRDIQLTNTEIISGVSAP